ncbi:MAG: hypothetical protein WCJ76_01135, partial [Comamonadaceae bacterium]
MKFLKFCLSDPISCTRSLKVEESMPDPTTKRGTEELAAAQRHLRAVIDNVPAMIGYWDKNLRN